MRLLTAAFGVIIKIWRRKPPALAALSAESEIKT
jgi:hypothetical protein